LRHSSYADEDGEYARFDQVAFILTALRDNPNSRRIIMTTWNPGEMANITRTNDNTQTPTCCHATMVQFFVRHGALHMKHYQRSADMLLGVPHNWVQYWALLLYFAHHSGLKPGSIRWDFGDAHIYAEDSHVQTAMEICAASPLPSECELIYMYSGERDTFGAPKFKASDFTITGDVSNPEVTTRPKLIA